MTKNFLRLLLLLNMAIIHPNALFAQTGGGGIDPNKHEIHIEGIVRNNDYNPLAGATIELIGYGMTATSDADGLYSFILSDSPQGFVLMQATAPSWGPNFSQEYIPQGKYIDLKSIPLVSKTEFIETLEETGPPGEMEINPYRQADVNFILQRRNGWTSDPIGMMGGTSESPNQAISVTVPAGAFDQDYRVVVTKLQHECYSTYDDVNRNHWAGSGLQFEAVLIDSNNQVIKNHNFLLPITLEIQQLMLQLPSEPGVFWDLEAAGVVNHSSCDYSLQAGVEIGWNSDKERFTFKLPHFSQWTCIISDEALIHKTNRPRVPRRNPAPDFSVGEKEYWEDRRSVQVVCGDAAGEITVTENIGDEVTTSFSAGANLEFRHFKPPEANSTALQTGNKSPRAQKNIRMVESCVPHPPMLFA